MSLSLSDLTQSHPDLAARVAEEAERVEAELLRQVDSQVRLVADVGKHTLRSGGKRLRPAFVALSALSCSHDYDVERATRLGACMELIHMATLIHDDVIDNAGTRRGRPTAGAVFGNTGSILSGDVLLAKAMKMLSVDEDMDIVRAVSDAVVEMAEGEVREVETRGDFDLSEEAHLGILRMKTASFIQCCCEIGALMVHASPERRLALREYGGHIGMAFQIADDLLDYRGDQDRTGKPPGTDFREGCATLPLILLRHRLSAAESEVTRQRFGNGVTDDEIRMICGWMESRGAFAAAQSAAERHADLAVAALGPLNDGSSVEVLRGVANYVVRRQT